jgi:hypothetical protein
VASAVVGILVVRSVTFCSDAIEVLTLVSLASDAATFAVAVESTTIEAFVLTTIASVAFRSSVLENAVEFIEVEVLVSNSREFALEEDEVDLKFELADLDLAADFVVGFPVGFKVDLGAILNSDLCFVLFVVAQLTAWSEALECQQKKCWEMARSWTHDDRILI